MLIVRTIKFNLGTVNAATTHKSTQKKKKVQAAQSLIKPQLHKNIEGKPTFITSSISNYKSILIIEALKNHDLKKWGAIIQGQHYYEAIRNLVYEKIISFF